MTVYHSGVKHLKQSMAKNLFIVTSALKPTIGVINEDDRFKQTIDTLESIRKVVPDALIVFTDGSPFAIEDHKLKQISSYVDVLLTWEYDTEICQLAKGGHKSLAENVLLMKTLFSLVNDESHQKLLENAKRIFKFSARSTLHDTFDISAYDNLDGKYVFKKRVPTWMPDKSFVDHLYITRMFSFCPTLIPDYFETIAKNIAVISQKHLDTEHAHFYSLDKDIVVEFDTLHCEGIMASTGAVERY
jgi:hypothetical protein